MNYQKRARIISSAVFLSLFCIMRSAATAGDGIFEGGDSGSLSGLVAGLREDSAKAASPEAAPGIQPADGNNELLHFWDELKRDAFDDICKGVEIPVSADLSLDGVGGIEGKLERSFKQYPDRHIAVVDEVRVKLDGGAGYQEALNLQGETFNVGFSASLEGRSVVVRKLTGVKYCAELLNIIDLRKAKTVLPVTSARLSSMGINEIWKLPAVLRIGVGASAGAAAQPGFTVAFSMGAQKEAKPSITLYRMAQNALRVRLRLDRATIKRADFSAGTTFDAGMIGLPEAEGPLSKALDRRLLKEFNKYLALKFGFFGERSSGKKILLEFLVDPADPAQLAKLVDFLKGDLGIIRELMQMGVPFNSYSETADNAAGAAALGGVEGAASQGLGLNSSFAGSNHYSGSSHGVNVTLPVVLQHEGTSGQRYDRYQTLGGGDVLHVQTSYRKASDANINLPFAGKQMKHNTEENIYVVNDEGKDGVLSDAGMIYQRYEGYIKHDERNTRGVLRGINEILKYAGVKGDGVNTGATVPADALFPRLAAEELNPSGVDFEGNLAVAAKRYKSSVISFSLMFSRQAVRDIINAPSVTLMKAVLNVMDGLDREILEKVRGALNIDPAGKVSCDWQAAKKALASYQQLDRSFDPFSVVNRFCLNVSRLAVDLAGVKGAADQKERSKRLARIMGGKGESRLGYDGLLQVLVQLVSVDDIYASMDVRVNKDIPGEENITGTYKLFNGGLQGEYEAQLGHATAQRDRFADPTELSD
jgi:hypothetical protein